MPRLRHAVALGAAVLLLSVGYSAHGKIVNRILAIVNYEVITEGDLGRLLDEHVQALRVYDGKSLEEATRIAESQRAELLDNVIAAALLDQEARRQAQENPALQVPQVALDEEIRQFRRERQLTDDAEFERTLRAQGYTQATFRREMLKNVRVRELIKRELIPRLHVTDAEVIQYQAAHQIADKSAAREALRNERFLEERERYIQSLRKKAFVKLLVRFE
jgi:peptidyl-prolyl cis-trans isomerase SurA